jgi:DNA-binding transcriptional ArsR family regulator
MPNHNRTKAHPNSRFAYEGLDRVIHEHARLSVLTSLMTHPRGLCFTELRQMCALTDGNLSRHLQVLEEAKLVTVAKVYDNSRAQTIMRISASGRKRYVDYLAVLERVVLDAAAAVKTETPPKILRTTSGS